MKQQISFSGALLAIFTQKGILFLYVLIFCIGVNCNSQNTYVFVGSYNFDKEKNGIYVFELDTLNGNLTKIITVKNILNPSYLTVSPSGKYIYACTDTKTSNAGSVSSFEFNAKNETLTYINSETSGGENPVYLSVHKNGKWLINANYTGGSFAVHSITEAGRINPMVKSFSYTDGSINKERQIRSHVHSSVFSPDCDFVFLPDLGADKIRCYQFDSSQQQPLLETENPYTKTEPGSGPRHLTFHPNGKYAYCIEEIAGFISVYQYEKGKLKPIQRIATHTDEVVKDYGSADIHTSPDGSFLYVTNRGEQNNFTIFSIEKEGTLKLKGYEPTSGITPRAFAIDSKGKFVIVANQTTGNIVVFKRDSVSGLLKKGAVIDEIPNASSVQIKEYK